MNALIRIIVFPFFSCFSLLCYFSCEKIVPNGYLCLTKGLASLVTVFPQRSSFFVEKTAKRAARDCLLTKQQAKV
jgi:hypothetical protein